MNGSISGKKLAAKLKKLRPPKKTLFFNSKNVNFYYDILKRSSAQENRVDYSGVLQKLLSMVYWKSY